MDNSQQLPTDTQAPTGGTAVVFPADPDQGQTVADVNASWIKWVATVAFAVTTVHYVLSMFDHIGGLTIAPFDSTACGVYMGSIITCYVGHRWTHSSYSRTVK